VTEVNVVRAPLASVVVRTVVLELGGVVGGPDCDCGWEGDVEATVVLDGEEESVEKRLEFEGELEELVGDENPEVLLLKT
jgi:hypothetical protein